MKRLFIAVKVNPEAGLLKIISTLKAKLADEKIKWVDPANVHLTIAFLGDTEEEKIKILSDMLSEKCTGFNEFEFLLSGTGVFRNYRDPRVIWAGIKSPDSLIELNNLITGGLIVNDFPVEEREFKPHLTLGRIKSIRDTGNLQMVLEKYKDINIQYVRITEVILFESILKQTGPLYKPLGRFRL